MQEYKHPVVLLSGALVLISLLAMFYFQFRGYETSMGWSLSSDPQFEEIVAYQFGKGPFEFQLMGEKVTLLESYYGEPINTLPTLSSGYFLSIIVGLVLLLASVTYLKQFGFLVFSALFILFLVQLNLDAFLETQNWIVVIPLALTVGLAYGFQAFWNKTTFLLRVGAFALSAGLLVFLMRDDLTIFTTHFFAHGVIPLLLVAFAFMAVIAEEVIFGLLFILTKNKGGESNHWHIMLIGGIYVANLLGYYLNQAGIFDFTFTFMNPYLLLVISMAVAAWSFRFKYDLIRNTRLFIPAFVGVFALGLITFSLLGFGFARGLDGIYEGLHYLIIYTHLGFGAAFLIYIIINFIDPLASGLQVFKVVYKPQSFHYVTARLAGLVAILAFFFMSGQAALDLFRGVKYDLLGDIEQENGNPNLAITYYENANFYAYNSHYNNYQLGSIFLSKSRQAAARSYFERASNKYPSPQSFLNTSNLQSATDVSLATAHLDRGLLAFPGQAELKNNLGLLHLRNERLESAYAQFRNTGSNQNWNQAPIANKWATLNAMRSVEDEQPTLDYESGNLVVKANILSALMGAGQSAQLAFDTTLLANSPFPIHRQAYLLNGCYYFLDSALSSYTSAELALPVLGLQGPLRKAQAINLYLSGRVRSAFQAFDQIQNGMTGTRAAEVLNEMGLLALDQNAPREALDFFLKAEENGMDTRFHQMVAMLEAGEYHSAQVILADLQRSDSVFYSLDAPLANVFSPRSDTTQESQFNYLYYRFSELNPDPLLESLNQFSSGSQQIIINRLVAQVENRGLNLDAYEALGLKESDYSALDSAKLVSSAYERPFNENLVLAAVEYIREDHLIEAYNFLSSALEYNPYSVSLLKAHAFMSIDLNLPDYADNSILKLSNILTGIEFLEFQKEWYHRKSEKESEKLY